LAKNMKERKIDQKRGRRVVRFSWWWRSSWSSSSPRRPRRSRRMGPNSLVDTIEKVNECKPTPFEQSINNQLIIFEHKSGAPKVVHV
jgi:hypothetical protein